MSAVHIFGIRHHGPGSARSLVSALESLAPDIVLVEGPPDADGVLPLLAHADMRPPVALLIYKPDEPHRAAFYPYAVFSPEYQATRYALGRGIPVRFMDLPQSVQLALADDPQHFASASASSAVIDAEPAARQRIRSLNVTEAAPIVLGATSEYDDEPAAIELPAVRDDPLGWLGLAAGYSDGERWWEHMVEQRRDGEGLFAAILEAMTVLRAEAEATEVAKPDSPEEARMAKREAAREAFMRQIIRKAQAEGFERIAVVCGAWHGPALAKLPPAKEDIALLRRLPRLKTVVATWVPWTNGRLSAASGYGAGLESPGWYAHLWETPEDVSVRWLVRVAQLLREQDLEASAASVIEAVRLAESLAALRDRPLPGLAELNEATQAVLCAGAELPMALIAEKLIVGEALGQVPDVTPTVPLQQDLAREQKQLRLKPAAAVRDLDLDLRQPTDLARSHLLHRLRLLDVPWGEVLGASARQRGTFHEIWRLQWHPELAVRLVEANHFGNTIPSAAVNKARALAREAPGLPALAELLDVVLLADLPEAAEVITARVQAEAAVAADLGLLMDALPPLANIARYGSVRHDKAEAEGMAVVVASLLTRVCIGLPLACASLNDDAAAAMETRLSAVHEAVLRLDEAAQRTSWLDALGRLADQAGLHGLLAGRCCRLLHDQGEWAPDELVRRLRLALSTSVEPGQSAAWIEGLLRGSGLLLLHDDALWAALDAWLADLPVSAFEQQLPLLRRTFAAFSAAERRQMGARAQHGRADLVAARTAPELNVERAEAVLPIIAQLLGLAKDST